MICLPEIKSSNSAHAVILPAFTRPFSVFNAREFWCEATRYQEKIIGYNMVPYTMLAPASQKYKNLSLGKNFTVRLLNGELSPNDAPHSACYWKMWQVAIIDTTVTNTNTPSILGSLQNQCSIVSPIPTVWWQKLRHRNKACMYVGVRVCVRVWVQGQI